MWCWDCRLVLPLGGPLNTQNVHVSLFDRPAMVCDRRGLRKEDIDCRRHSVTCDSGPEKCLRDTPSVRRWSSTPGTIPTKSEKSRRSKADAVALVMAHDVGHDASMEQAPVGHPVVFPYVMLDVIVRWIYKVVTTLLKT